MAFRVFRFAVAVLNNVMFIGEPGGSNRSWVSNRSWGVGHYCSNRSQRLLLEEIWQIKTWLRLYCIWFDKKFLSENAGTYSESCTMSWSITNFSASSLCTEANEPPLYLWWKRLSLQYAHVLWTRLSNVFLTWNQNDYLLGNPHRLLHSEYELLRTWVVLVLAIKTERCAQFHMFLHGCYVALDLIMTCMHSTKIVSVQTFYRIFL